MDPETRDSVTAYILDIDKMADQLSAKYTLPTPGEQQVSSQGLVAQPLNFNDIGKLFDSSTVLRKAATTKARDVVGLGWTLLATDPETEGPQEAMAAFKKFMDTGAIGSVVKTLYKDADSNERETEPINILSNAQEQYTRLLLDLITTGNGYMAVTREARLSEDEPLFYQHVPSRGLLRHKDRLRFKWGSNRTAKWYKLFGVEVDVSIRDGSIHEHNTLEEDMRAPEMITWEEYSPTSLYYGMPEVAPAFGAVVMQLLARDYNIKWFENGAIPEYAVITEGLDEASQPKVNDAITKFFSQQGVSNMRKTLMINLPGRTKDDEQLGIKFEKVSTEMKDGSFKLLSEDSRDEVLASMAVPAYRLGFAIQGSLGGSTIRKADEIYKFEEIDPLRELLEAKVNHLLVPLFDDAEGFSWTWNQIDTSDSELETDLVVKQISNALITPNEGRERLGMERVETEGVEDGEEPMDQHYWNGTLLGTSTIGMTNDELEARANSLRADMGFERDNED